MWWLMNIGLLEIIVPNPIVAQHEKNVFAWKVSCLQLKIVWLNKWMLICVELLEMKHNQSIKFLFRMIYNIDEDQKRMMNPEWNMLLTHVHVHSGRFLTYVHKTTKLVVQTFTHFVGWISTRDSSQCWNDTVRYLSLSKWLHFVQEWENMQWNIDDLFFIDKGANTCLHLEKQNISIFWFWSDFSFRSNSSWCTDIAFDDLGIDLISVYSSANLTTFVYD